MLLMAQFSKRKANERVQTTGPGQPILRTAMAKGTAQKRSMHVNMSHQTFNRVDACYLRQVYLHLVGK